MSIWGKIGGAAAGFILGGGPIGAALGALAGHAVFDREPGEDEKQLAFTMGVTALAAKMAKADGQSTDAEFHTDVPFTTVSGNTAGWTGPTT